MSPAPGRSHTDDQLADLCQNAPSIAERLAEDPGRSVDRIVTRMRREWAKKTKTKTRIKSRIGRDRHRDEVERLKWAESCGSFPYRPSDLFLKVYADVLDSISRDPFSNLISPSLTGSSGVIPLSIVSVIPDIMKHYAELIEHAQHEVFLATNYWESSHSSRLVADALRKLSRRYIEEGRRNEDEKIVVKVMYDRGSASQLIHNHVRVPPAKWEAVGLPRPDELEGIRLEALNYHRPILGTFHAKYLVVDRKIACINSNNVQDRPNVEMCVHLEGPIVDSFYDIALFSWADKMDPPLPLLSRSMASRKDYKFGEENESLRYIDTQFSSLAARALLQKQYKQEAREMEGDSENAERRQAAQSANGSAVSQAIRAAVGIPAGAGGTHGKDEVIGEHPAMSLSSDANDSGVEISNGAQARTRERNEDDNGLNEAEKLNMHDDERDLEERQARPRTNSTASSPLPTEMNGSAIQGDSCSQPPSSASAISISPSGPEALKTEEDKDEDICSCKSKRSRIEAVTRHLNGPTLNEKGTADDDEDVDGFRPHITHRSHSPVPIAMVNRAPRGTPGHENVKEIPQNIAWLSLMKNAKESIFIQTPTFNASPLIPATLDACRRGVQVTLYLDLGFNDLGEMIPFQGGTNEQVVHNMYKALNKEGRDKAENLKVYWYTAKDQKEPVSATKKSRNCHVKFMAVDSQVTMLGNGNQDTQSWFHSQETNVLVDSAQLTAEWLSGIDANQSTHKFGLVDNTDGIWRARDGSGRVVQSSGVKSVGPIAAMKGMLGALRRHFRY